MQTFLSCDWGSTNFRLRLVNATSLRIVHEVSNDQGIIATNERFAQQVTHQTRLNFYKLRLADAVDQLQRLINVSLANIPIIISGMASSTLGMLELRYTELPVKLDHPNLQYKVFVASPELNHEILLISGLKSVDDVIRGEETKILGCKTSAQDANSLYILPGTHTKHVKIQKGEITGFFTYMTGEIFQILSTTGVLKQSVTPIPFDEAYTTAFLNGVSTGATVNILHTLFTTRTNQLFNLYTKAENYYYLSGLLIGHELKDVIGETYTSIRLITNKALQYFYQSALEYFLPQTPIEIIDSDTALINGQFNFAKQHNFI